MDTQITKAEKNVPSTQHTVSWGTDDLDSSDIVIPRLLLMQGLSQFVTEGKAKAGDFINSVTMEQMGGKDKSVELVLVDHFKNWIVSEKGPKENRFKFRQIVSWKDGDPKWEFESKEGDTTVRRYQCLNFYVLPTDGLDGLPLLLTFRSTSYKAGRKVVTFASQAKMYKKPLGYRTIKLGTVTETNDFGTFYVFTVEQGRLAKADELEKAYQWFQTVRQKDAVVIDDKDESDVSL